MTRNGKTACGRGEPPIPARIATLAPYEPGRPIEEVRRELGLEDVVKLASNENPLGPSPRALAAVRAALQQIHRYPEGGAPELAGRLAERLRVDRSMLVFGNGSNELIDLLVRLFVAEGDEVIASADAFVVYRLVATAEGAVTVAVPSRDFHHDLDAIASRVTARTRVVFVASPNNPTGTIVRRAEWRRFLERVPPDVVVVMDQAYAQYVDDPEYADALDDVRARGNVVALRTFSKIYGLAALRIGYAIAPPPIADALQRLRQPFNVNGLAQVAALAALDDEEHVARSRALVRRARAVWAERLACMGIESVPSQANFILLRVGDGRAVTDALLRRGVIVRPMAAYGLPAWIRVTFGTPQEDERFFGALREVL